MQVFPKRIKFLSDDSEAVLVREEKTKTSKVTVGYYKYVISNTKNGIEQPMELDYLNKLQSFELLKVLILE